MMINWWLMALVSPMLAVESYPVEALIEPNAGIQVELGIEWSIGPWSVRAAISTDSWWQYRTPWQALPHRMTGWGEVEYRRGQVALGLRHASTHPVVAWAPKWAENGEILPPGFDSGYNAIYLRIGSRAHAP